jgi:hypothetical protein
MSPTNELPGVASSSNGAPGGARLLLTDTRIGLALLNEARYRTMEQVFGLSKEQVNMATVVGALGVAAAMQARWRRFMEGPPLPPVPDMALGITTFRESVYAVVGPSAADIPLLGTLIAIGVIGSVTRPVVVRGLRGIRVSSQRVSQRAHAGFNHRYGHLVGHGRRHLARVKSARREKRPLTNR